MNTEQLKHYVMRYLETTDCHVIEKSPAHVTVKLSPEADRALTGRSYYWSFVERTGADPETMTYTFVFDPEHMEWVEPNKDDLKHNIRMHREHLTYGNSRLLQIFQAVKSKGRYVHMYEEPPDNRLKAFQLSTYSSWFGVNYKVEFRCDMKRDEVHSLGISLTTGEIVEQFHPYLLTKNLTPRLPANTHIKETIQLHSALKQLDSYLAHNIQQVDHSWAFDAKQRMQVELERMESYYHDLIQCSDEENKEEIQTQFQNRREEIEWQYKPRIHVDVMNCGIFHLLAAEL